eukprot:scaffold6931_cov62-Cylindrotheca_fusiformis.AAC.1
MVQRIQKAAVDEEQKLKEDIQLAAGELTARVEKGTMDEEETKEEPPEDTRQAPIRTQQPAGKASAMWQQERTQDAGTLAEQLDTKFKITKETRPMNRDDALAFYNQIKDKMDQKGLPLKAFDDLQARGNCLPEGATSHFGQSTIDTISH